MFLWPIRDKSDIVQTFYYTDIRFDNTKICVKANRIEVSECNFFLTNSKHFVYDFKDSDMLDHSITI